MTSVPEFWEDSPEAWARVIVTDSNGTIYGLPGIAEVEVENTYGLDIRPSPLAEGATYIPTGNPPQSVNIKLTIWEKDHWIAWSVMLGILQPPAKRQLIPKAFGVYHPILAAHGVTAIVFKKLGSPKPVSTGGPCTIAIEAVEYKPLKPVKTPEITADTRDTSLFKPLLPEESVKPPSTRAVGVNGGSGLGADWTPRK